MPFVHINLFHGEFNYEKKKKNTHTHTHTQGLSMYRKTLVQGNAHQHFAF